MVHCTFISRRGNSAGSGFCLCKNRFFRAKLTLEGAGPLNMWSHAQRVTLCTVLCAGMKARVPLVATYREIPFVTKSNHPKKWVSGVTRVWYWFCFFVVAVMQQNSFHQFSLFFQLNKWSIIATLSPSADLHMITRVTNAGGDKWMLHWYVEAQRHVRNNDMATVRFFRFLHSCFYDRQRLGHSSQPYQRVLKDLPQVIMKVLALVVVCWQDVAKSVQVGYVHENSLEDRRTTFVFGLIPATNVLIQGRGKHVGGWASGSRHHWLLGYPLRYCSSYNLLQQKKACYGFLLLGLSYKHQMPQIKGEPVRVVFLICSYLVSDVVAVCHVRV